MLICRYVKVGGTRHQFHLGACLGQRLGQGEAHLAAGVVADEAHGVDFLVGGPCGDQPSLALQGFAFCAFCVLQQCCNIPHNFRRLRHAARAAHTAGQLALGGAHDAYPPPPQRRQVALHGGVRPHVAVHGRRHDDGLRGEGKQQGAQCVVGHSGSHFADDVGRGRRHHQQLTPVFERDMLGAARSEEVAVERSAAHRLQRGTRDKLQRVLRGGAAHLVAGLHQQAHQFRHFVGRNATRDPNDNSHFLLLRLRLFDGVAVVDLPVEVFLGGFQRGLRLALVAAHNLYLLAVFEHFIDSIGA